MIEITEGWARALRPSSPTPARFAAAHVVIAKGAWLPEMLDRHPEFEHVTLVSACSGHGFKHSAPAGEAAAASGRGHDSRVDPAAAAGLAQVFP